MSHVLNFICSSLSGPDLPQRPRRVDTHVLNTTVTCPSTSRDVTALCHIPGRAFISRSNCDSDATWSRGHVMSRDQLLLVGRDVSMQAPGERLLTQPHLHLLCGCAIGMHAKSFARHLLRSVSGGLLPVNHAML